MSMAPSKPTGILYRVDRESLNTLIEKYVTSLTTNAAEQERVEKLKQEYVTVRSRLSTLPQQLEYDALVPLGRRAVCPGKIIHTNEIMCLLGDNWFVECSAAKAVEIVNHRIAKLDEQHEGLKKEQELINNWKQEAERQLIETIGHGTVEIREDYVEEQEMLWRKQHRESLRRYHQELSKQRLEAKQEKENGRSTMSDRELWTRLDELEIQEELDDYLEQESITEEKAVEVASFLSEPNRMVRSQKTMTKPNNELKEMSLKSDTTSTRRTSSQENSKPDTDTNTTTTKKTERVAAAAASLPSEVNKRRVKFSADNIIHDISDDINYSNQENYNHDDHDKSQSTTDDNSMSMPTYPCFEPIIIRFRHSSLDEIGYHRREASADTSGTEEDDKINKIVSSPAEIVKVFGPTSISGISSKPLPKSILKPYAPPLVALDRERDRNKKAKEKSMRPSFGDEDLNDDETPSAISKVVTERVPVFTSLQLNDNANANPSLQKEPSNTTATTTNKPVSLFKMRRQDQLMAVTSPD